MSGTELEGRRNALLHQCTPKLKLHFDDFLYVTHISLRYKYIFVATPKAACSSLIMMLQRLEWNDTHFLHNPTWEVHDRALSPLLNPLQVISFSELVADPEFLKFCFVRNPFDRIISAYLNKVVKEDHFREDMLATIGKSGVDVSFDEFISYVASKPDEQMDLHFAVQHNQTFQDMITFDFIGKFEQFDADLATMSHLLKVNLAPYHVRFDPHRTGAKRYGAFLTERNTALILEKYARDFETFSYSRIPPR